MPPTGQLHTILEHLFTNIKVLNKTLEVIAYQTLQLGRQALHVVRETLHRAEVFAHSRTRP